MQPGIPLALAPAVLFGASTPFAKLLLGSVGPWLMAGLLYLGAGIGLLAALVGGVLGPLFLMFGLAQTNAAAASLVLNLEGLATMSIAGSCFKRMLIDGFCSELCRFWPARRRRLNCRWPLAGCRQSRSGSQALRVFADGERLRS